MRAFASLLAASAARRAVASLNLCTDEFLLLLAAPDRSSRSPIWRSDPAETPLWRQARRYPRNDGSLLSVAAAAARPGGDHGRRRARPARSPGGSASRTLDLPFAASLADVERNLARLAAALGRRRPARLLRGWRR